MMAPLDQFESLRLAVLGDLMMDEYLWGDATRVSPESPVLVIDVARESAVPGGAANVAANVTALGGQAAVFGVVGDDDTGRQLLERLDGQGADVAGVVTDPGRTTTRKTRVVAQSQQVLRIDREVRQPLAGEVADDLTGRLRGRLGELDGVIVSDYAKGVVCPQTSSSVVVMAREASVPVFVNAKPSSAGLMSGATVVTLNLAEAIAASGDDRFRSDALDEPGHGLRAKVGCETLVVTRGAKGLALFGAGGETVLVPARTVDVYDVAGAGDTVVSTLAMAMAAGAGLREAAELAVVAAAVVVGKVGVATVTLDELRSHLSA
jgi:D-glycero-beta-D-manno-heptose-7-phosphate kinase